MVSVSELCGGPGLSRGCPPEGAAGTRKRFYFPASPHLKDESVSLVGQARDEFVDQFPRLVQGSELLPPDAERLPAVVVSDGGGDVLALTLRDSQV